MTDLTSALTHAPAHVAPRHNEGTTMLLHEALARSRQREAEQAARVHALARSMTAGRRWAVLARFAARRAEHARTRTRGAVPTPDPASRSWTGGLRSAV